jgi:hypothetical protein
MKLFSVLFIVPFLVSAIADAAEPTADFYVSPAGSDSWSGKLADPDNQNSDGPFATLQRARDAVRQSGKNRLGDVTVLIRGGTYKLSNTVVFGVQDAGQDDWTVTYQAYPNEKPIFSSGQEVKDWQTLDSAPPGLPKKAVSKVRVAFALRCPRDTSPRSVEGLHSASWQQPKRTAFPRRSFKELAERERRGNHRSSAPCLDLEYLAVGIGG